MPSFKGECACMLRISTIKPPQNQCFRGLNFNQTVSLSVRFCTKKKKKNLPKKNRKQTGKKKVIIMNFCLIESLAGNKS